MIDVCCLNVVLFVCSGERVVDVGGVGCPCGGTHVKNTADIKGVTITKIKKVCVCVLMCIACTCVCCGCVCYSVSMDFFLYNRVKRMSESLTLLAMNRTGFEFCYYSVVIKIIPHEFQYI